MEKVNELKDIGKNGKEKPWKEKKLTNIKLKEIYQELYRIEKIEKWYKRSLNLDLCGTFLEFRTDANYDRKKLYNANFCRLRLCPLCIWRRSLKIFSSVSRIVSKLADQYEFEFLTFTIRNVKGEDLKKAIADINKAFNCMTRKKRFKNEIYGYIRTLEVTVNKDMNNKEWYGTYHPHIHCIVAVKKRHKVWSEREIRKLWQENAKLAYYPQCDARKIETRKITETPEKALQKAIAETSKYAVKDKDIIIKDSKFDLINHIKTLDLSLTGCRLVTMGGVCKKVGVLLHCESPEEGDLIDVYSDPTEEELDCIVRYIWDNGYLGYYKMD